jgi:hypothetical protein
MQYGGKALPVRRLYLEREKGFMYSVLWFIWADGIPSRCRIGFSLKSGLRSYQTNESRPTLAEAFDYVQLKCIFTGGLSVNYPIGTPPNYLISTLIITSSNLNS